MYTRIAEKASRALPFFVIFYSRSRKVLKMRFFSGNEVFQV